MAQLFSPTAASHVWQCVCQLLCCYTYGTATPTHCCVTHCTGPFTLSDLADKWGTEVTEETYVWSSNITEWWAAILRCRTLLPDALLLRTLLCYPLPHPAAAWCSASSILCCLTLHAIAWALLLLHCATAWLILAPAAWCTPLLPLLPCAVHSWDPCPHTV